MTFFGGWTHYITLAGLLLHIKRNEVVNETNRDAVLAGRLRGKQSEREDKELKERVTEAVAYTGA